MREYVEEHSSEATLKQLRAAPVSKVGGWKEEALAYTVPASQVSDVACATLSFLLQSWRHRPVWKLTL
jgi:hypothetical protein